MLFKEIITVYTENHTNSSVQNAESVNVKVGGTYFDYSVSAAICRFDNNC
jgi:hypothetical protein